MRLMYSVVCSVFLVCFLAVPSHGQQVRLEGKVYDGQLLQPLPAATILVGDQVVVSTDEKGYFTLMVPPGDLIITFHYLGYQNVRKEIRVDEGVDLFLDVAMDPSVTEMDQVVVSASRVAQRIAESMVSLNVIRFDQLHDAHQSSPRELLDRVAGIEVMDGQVSIRGGSGFSYGAGSRVLVLIDGLPALTPDAGSVRWQALPLENMSQVEVIKGASSVLYGSSAMNGVVNFRSASPTTDGQTNFYAETSVFDTPRNKNWKWWESPPTAYRISFSHMKQHGQTSLSIGSFALMDNGYRKLNEENLLRANVRIKHSHADKPGLEYGLALQGGMIWKHDFLLWEDAFSGALKQNPETANKLNGMFFYVDPFVTYQHGANTSHALRMRLQASDNAYVTDDKNDSQTRAGYAEYHLLRSLHPNLTLNAGISADYKIIMSPFYGDHTGSNMAVFSQADLILSPSLSAVAGLRGEFNVLNGEQDRLIPLMRMGLLYKLTDKTFLRSSFGQGYRYPSIAEKFASTTVGAVRIIPNPGIAPESGWNAEIAIKQGLLGDHVDGLLDLAFFYGQNKDMIEFVFGVYRNPLTGQFETGFRAANIEFSRIYGMELDARVHVQTGRTGHTFSGGYVLMMPVELDPVSGKETGNYLKFRRKHSASAGWRISKGPMFGQLDVWYRSSILAIDEVFLHPATREQVLPGFYQYWMEHNTGYFLMNLGIGYAVSSRMNASLVLKNLTNAEYMGRPGDIQPHRQLSIRLSLGF